MTLVIVRTRDVGQTGRLSAGAQSVGYLIAATGPLVVGEDLMRFVVGEEVAIHRREARIGRQNCVRCPSKPG
mgnify:CR=1 FL=1